MKKSCAIGCAVLFVLAAVIVGVVIKKGPEWFQKGKDMVLSVVAEEERITAFEKSWTPPSPAPDETWAPAEVTIWTLKQSEAAPGWPELNIDRGGYRMIYESGPKTVEIGVVAANDLEKETLVERAQGALSTGNGTRTTTTFGNRVEMKVDGKEQTRLWWLKNFLFFFRTTGDADLPVFAEQYLTAIAGPPAVEEPPAVEATPAVEAAAAPRPAAP